MDHPIVVRKPMIVSPDDGRVYQMGRIRAVFKADRHETDARYSISEWSLEPSTRGPGVHAHPEDHVYYVIEGTVSVLIGGSWSDAARGTYVIIPGGTPHDFENRGSDRAGFISLNHPGGFEERMPEIAEALAAMDLRL